MESNQVVQALSALAHPVRLQVFRSLVVAGEQGISPGIIAERLDIPAATLSFHLKEMLHAGIVSCERQGRHLIYRAAYRAMAELLAYLSENCCAGARCEASEAIDFKHC